MGPKVKAQQRAKKLRKQGYKARVVKRQYKVFNTRKHPTKPNKRIGVTRTQIGYEVFTTKPKIKKR